MKYEDVPMFMYSLQSQINELQNGVKENSELLNIRMDKLEQNQVELEDDIETIMLRLPKEPTVKLRIIPSSHDEFWE